jgi:hypothetical protein
MRSVLFLSALIISRDKRDLTNSESVLCIFLFLTFVALDVIEAI